jgi:chromatin remodeling complex protein RSC6
LHRRFFVDDVLRAIIGRAMTTRPEAVRLVWNYIKRNNLQKPENGRIILPDQRLGALTGEPGVEFSGFKLMTHIQRHILPPHPLQ